METTTKPKHIGRNISRIRELRGMKQEALAMAIGVSQQTISNIENSEAVEEEKLLQIANALNVSTDAIKKFNEDSILNIVSNSFTSNDSSTLNAINIQPTFNPLDKVVTLFEEKEKLYERLLQAEKDKVTYLEKLLNHK
jgi:transcriptional regulator with XRE-family HTH domain